MIQSCLPILLPIILSVAFISGSYAQCRSTNLCFALDESGSISILNFQLMAKTVIDIVDRYNNIAPGTNFAAVSFGFSAEVVSNLTSNVDNFKASISENEHTFAFTEHIGDALRLCSELLSEENGQQVILVFADGQDGQGEALEAAAELQERGVTIATVGIGSGADRELLQDIASTQSLYTDVSDFSNLADSISKITDTICIVQPFIEQVYVVVPLILSLLMAGVVAISVIPAIFAAIPFFNFGSSIGNFRGSGKSGSQRRKRKNGRRFDFRLTRFNYINC